MKPHLSMVVVVTVGSLLGAASAQHDPKGDQEKIQGTWKVVSLEVRGESAGDKAKNHKIVFTKDKMIFKDGDKTDGEFTYKLDPAQKPKWIDLAPNGKDGKPGKTAHGIYELDGDTLKICHPDPGKERSRAFASKPDSLLIVLKRERP